MGHLLLERIWSTVQKFRGAILLWAGIATILALFLAIYSHFNPRPVEVEIGNLDDFSKILVHLREYAERDTFHPDAQTVDRISQLDDVVRRKVVATIEPTSKSFVLGEGKGVFLANGAEGRITFAVSDIYPQSTYLYVVVNAGERKQLYTGQGAEFDIDDAKCTVTLMGIDENPIVAGSFYFQCL